MKALGVDLGTTSVAAVVFDTAAASVVWSMSRPHGASLQVSDPLAAEQDAARIMDIAAGMVDAGLAAHPDVQALGVTGQMHGLIYLDDRLRPLSPLFTWQDGRGGRRVADGELETFAQQLSRLTGCRVAPGFAMATHAYLAAHGLVPRGAASLVTLPDAFAARLASRSRPLLHASLAHSMGGFDLDQAAFSADGLAAAGIDLALIPEVVSDPTVVGAYRGVPVAVALGDHQASFLGAVGAEEGAVLVNIGTGAQVSVCVTGSPALPSEAELRPFVGPRRLASVATLAGGAAYALVASFFDRVVRMYGQEPVRSAYDALDEAIGAWREAGGGPFPRVRPTFFGVRWSEEQGARIEAWTAAGMVPEAFAWGVLRGIAEELHAGYLRLLGDEKPAPSAIAGAGNALRQNRHLLDAVAEVFGCPVSLAPYPEEAAQGAARWAAMAV
ncbi:sedoheptulokinase [Alicyclobacillus vulcanalis]|uniref:Sedoheptulokinase n=1 Tax=Alicyclobacillus vulcanalis TaxID=252246 RepID=A0A1N7N5M1_9BACL|nr:FGGY family carbohydrate kinase [Alicyclobacillus vulcanalis]SIS93703.1 sedoheptulokinase [Alicyclobacillus vulcanalis]